MNLRVTLYTLFLIGLLISPIFFLQLVIEPSQVPRFAFVCIALLAFFIWVLNSKVTIYLPKNLVLIPLVIFYLINLTSTFWSLNFAEGFYESQKIFLFIVLIIVCSSLFKNLDLQIILKTSILSLCGLIIITFFDLYFSANLENPDSLILFGHKNILSAILLLSLILSVLSYLSLKQFHAVHITSFVITLGLIFFLQTRSIYLALAVISIIVLGFSIKNLKSNYRRLAIIGASIFSIGVICLLVLDLTDSSSLSERMKLWEKSFLLFKEHPFFGVGTGNWQFNFSQFGVSDIERSFDYNIAFKRPHNDFVSIITEVGLIGFLPIFWVMIWMFKTILNNRKKIDFSYLLVLIGLVSYFIFSNFSFPKERIILVVLIALFFSGFLIKNDSLVPLNAKKGLSSMLILFSIGLLGVSFYRIKGEFHTKQLLAHQEIGKGLFVIDQSKKAQSVFYSVDPTGTPIKSYEGWGYNEITDLPSLLKANEEAVTLCPYNYQVLTNYGYILERTFHFKDAEKVLLFSYEINKKYEPTLLNLSVLHYNLGHYQTSMDWLKKINGYQKKYPQNLERISQAIFQTQ